MTHVAGRTSWGSSGQRQGKWGREPAVCCPGLCPSSPSRPSPNQQEQFSRPVWGGEGQPLCEVGLRRLPRAGPAADPPTVSHAAEGLLGYQACRMLERRTLSLWPGLWLEGRLGLHRREFSPRAHRLSRFQIYKLKIINNSNQAVINLRSLSMNPDSIS